MGRVRASVCMRVRVAMRVEFFVEIRVRIRGRVRQDVILWSIIRLRLDILVNCDFDIF